ncbi:GyrI-like domain-containing protein [Ancylobacter sp. SL191]|uniref:GyrI-like domain-containing protein n=1 Tax=Ancylobacter sp. SL191 TaxID=2995166 RepID=UPI0022703BBD|nr:GyrI-like domain-containing protein [Ancylobacter sp. SL191]WAC28676.1 GyrI-like domain-containing protein [Ancylobacter sp. SL191]
MTFSPLSARARPCWLVSTLAVLLVLILASAPLAPLQAQSPAPPANGGTDSAPLDDDDMVAPPVIDPKSVETQAVAPEDDPLKRPDGFGDLAELKPVPVLMKAAKSGWDDAFASIVATLRQVDAEMTRLGLKPHGAPFVIYTATGEESFDYEVAVPFDGATTEKPGNGVVFSASPAGKALRFTHRGPYDAMDPTYEQIANLLDAKDLEAQDLYVEEYRSDPRTTSPDDLVIDIWVPLK